MMDTHLLELPLSRTYFHGPEGVQAIEVLLHIKALEEQKVLSFIDQEAKLKALMVFRIRMAKNVLQCTHASN